MNANLHPFLLFFLGAALLMSPGMAEDAAPTAQDLSARLSAAVQDGSSAFHLRMEIRPSSGAAKTTLQLQVKSRRTKAATEITYQVVWPKDRKGESFLLRRTAGQPADGAVFTPPDTLRTLSASKMQEGVFGSQLTYEDLAENFFSWENQAITGTETVDRVSCQILESKPGKNDRSSYSKVRSWIDVKKMVPVRVEKYAASGKLASRIDTTRVAKDDKDRPVPASLMVRRTGQDSVTELEGSNIKHDVTFKDADFTPEALKALSKAK